MSSKPVALLLGDKFPDFEAETTEVRRSTALVGSENQETFAATLLCTFETFRFAYISATRSFHFEAEMAEVRRKKHRFVGQRSGDVRCYSRNIPSCLLFFLYMYISATPPAYPRPLSLDCET